MVTSEYRLAVIGWTYSYGMWDSYASPLIILDGRAVQCAYLQDSDRMKIDLR